MGRYINPGNDSFKTARNSEYVDKSGIIEYLNGTLNTEQKLTCVSRPRRFGKSITAGMLCAYYSMGCDSLALFEELEISTKPGFKDHLNKYPLLYIDVTNFINGTKDIEKCVDRMQSAIVNDLIKNYPEVAISSDDSLIDAIYEVVSVTKQKFVVIIDEWDAICREAPNHPELMKQYIALLRRMFKSNETDVVFAGVYMTGILPIKQYGTQSALNNFQPFSMTDPEPLEVYFGFTSDEVKDICNKHERDFEEMKEWYDGYRLGSNQEIFNPNSVITSLKKGVCANYWSKTESFESLKEYINMDFDGMQIVLEKLLAGESVEVSTIAFGNDANQIFNANELLTLLIHFGYLSYDKPTRSAFIPNMEVKEEIKSAIVFGSHTKLIEQIKNSERLLKAVWSSDEVFVADFFRSLHGKYCDPMHYNNEQALRGLVKHAFNDACVDKYVRIEELPSGEGYIDIAYIPRCGFGYPAMVIELKYNKCSEGAIAQIKNNHYPSLVSEFTDNLLLVGINYDPKSKKHSCRIEALKGIQPSTAVNSEHHNIFKI